MSDWIKSISGMIAGIGSLAIIISKPSYYNKQTRQEEGETSNQES